MTTEIGVPSKTIKYINLHKEGTTDGEWCETDDRWNNMIVRRQSDYLVAISRFEVPMNKMPINREIVDAIKIYEYPDRKSDDVLVVSGGIDHSVQATISSPDLLALIVITPIERGVAPADLNFPNPIDSFQHQFNHHHPALPEDQPPLTNGQMDHLLNHLQVVRHYLCTWPSGNGASQPPASAFHPSHHLQRRPSSPSPFPHLAGPQRSSGVGAFGKMPNSASA